MSHAADLSKMITAVSTLFSIFCAHWSISVAVAVIVDRDFRPPWWFIGIKLFLTKCSNSCVYTTLSINFPGAGSKFIPL